MSRLISIPSLTGEVITLTPSELCEYEVKEIKDLLLSEKAPMAVWYSVMMEYWRAGETRASESKDGTKEVSSKFESVLRDALIPKNVPCA